MKTLLGREPVAITAAVGAILAFLVSFGWDRLSAADATNILAVVSAVGAVIAGWTTVNTRLSLVTGVVRTVLILAVSYGLNLTQEQAGLAVIAISAVAAFGLRSQNSPVDTPVSVA